MADSMGDDGGGPRDGVPRSRPNTPRASTGGASLSAWYLSQPQRLVGCSLPPLARDAGVTKRTRGFVTLAVPHILESAATTQSLPEITLVRFRWKNEENARGSLFQPAKITNAPGLLLQRQATRRQREMAGDEHNADDSGEEEESKQHSPSSHASARPIEMVYPVCVDAQRFVEYLRDMNELVLDVIDRNTRRKYGKCVIPLFNEPPVASSGDSHSSLESSIDSERALRQLRRKNALYEIKSVDSNPDDDDMIGYLAVKIDVQFRDLDGGDLVDPVPVPLLPSRLDAALPPAPVLIPRTRPAVHVNVRQPFDRRQHDNGELRRRYQFEVMSPISYLESDAFHSLEGSSPRSEGVLSSLSSSPRRGEKRTHEVTGTPMHSSKLNHLIEKGKALQKSMAKAAEGRDGDWYDSQFPVTSVRAHIAGAQEINDAALHEDLSDSVSDHDPRSWQSILKQAQTPSHDIEQEVAHSSLIGSGKAIHSHSIKATRGLKITFEALKFSSDFIDQLQQMRDSAISSRFNPIEMTVSHSDVAALLATTTTESSVSQTENPETLFTITPSLRKRAFRLTYSHVVPLQPRGDSSTLGLISRSSKKQLQFFITSKIQGTPRRFQQSSRNGKKHQLVLRGAVSVHDILFDQGPTPEPKVENVSLFILEESGSAAARLRSRENAHRVGVLKVKFHLYNVEPDNSEPEIKGERHLIFSSPPSSRESVARSAEAQNSLLEARRKKPRERSKSRERSNPTLDETRKRPAPTLKIATQLAVMIDKVSSVRSSEARLTKFALEGSFVRFQYSIPQSSSASESSQPVSSFKRSFKRKLIRVAGSQNCLRTCYANVGHIAAFPLELDLLLNRDFKKKLLIIEAWLQGVQHAKDDEGELLGLVKIPFSAFSPCFRESSRDWDQAIPFVGVDGRLPIEDPFSGRVSGFLQTRIAVGTAEQIIALISTVRAIVQLQAIVRGALCRKANHIHRETEGYSTAEGGSAQTSTSNESPDKEREDVSRDRIITVAPTEASSIKERWGPLQRPDNDEGERNVIQHADNDIQGHDSIASRNDYVHEICLKIRECWRSARQGHSEQRGAWKEPSSVIGCEVQGELLLVHDQMTNRNEAKSVQFALWWDASHSQLNSHFEHSLRSKDSSGEDGLLVNEVKFTFHAQTDFAQPSSSNADQGQAVLNLQTILEDAINPDSLRNQHFSLEKDIDVPIEWEDGSNSRLCRVFPVRVCYRVSSRTPASLDQFQPILSARSPPMPNKEQAHSSWTTTTTSISATRRLLPATITLSIHVLSVADLKHAIEERWSQVCASSSEKDLKKHLEELLTDGAASVIFECNVCLGVEVAEQQSVGRNGASSYLYMKNERWYKKCRFLAARCDVGNTQQLLSNTLSPCQLEIVVHPEAMHIMQNECVEFRIISLCPRSNAEYQIGAVSVPIAAVLFRPTGVQGTFPISIGDVLSGRLGVHVHIDHQPGATSLDPKVPAMGLEERELVTETAESIVHRPVSPTSPGEVATGQNPSSYGEESQPIQVVVEDFRNLQYQDDGIDERGVLFSFATEYFDGEDRLRGGAFASVDHFHRIGDTETRSLSSSRVGRNPTLRIGVWYDDRTNAEDFAGTEFLARSAMLIGWRVVDLSLLLAWRREIHGWYHIFDGQQISRGQVKIKASLDSGEHTMEETQENSLSATQHLERRERELAEGLSGDGDQESFQLGFSMFSDTPRSKGADESRMPLSLSAKHVASSVNSMSEMSIGRLEAIKPSNHLEEYDEDSKGFPAAPNTVRLEQIDEQTGDCEDEMIAERDAALADVNGHYDHAATEADDITDRSPVDRCYKPEADSSAVSDEGDDQIDEATSYYKPITLSSFGIEEIQLSPLSDRLSPSTSSTDQNLLTPAGEKYDEQVTLTELEDRETVELESSATSPTPICIHDDLEEAFVNNLRPLSATSPCEESDDAQDITKMRSGHATAEEDTCKSGSDRASESSTCCSPVQLDTARRESFFAIEEHHGTPNESWTTSVHLNEETRLLNSGDGDQDSGSPVYNRLGISLEPVTILHEISNLGGGDHTPTVPNKRDAFEDEETVSRSEPNGECVDVAVKTYEIAKDEKSTQVGMESCILEEDVLGKLNGAESDSDHGIQTNSEVIGIRERGDSMGQDIPQTELLRGQTTKKKMVDVGCGTTDDFDNVADQISTHESNAVMKQGGEPTEDHLELIEKCVERSYSQDDETLEADGGNTDAPPSGDYLKGSVSSEMQSLYRHQESAKQPSFDLPADKFELICQLLTEIRDSCGSGLVKEILLAHNAQVALSESRMELLSQKEHFSTSQDRKVTAKQSEAETKTNQIHMDDLVITRSLGEELTSSFQKLRQSSGSVLIENTKGDSIAKRDYNDRLSYSSDVARENSQLSPTHFSRQDLKAAYWSDSSTLQQEIERRLAASDAGQGSRNTIDCNNIGEMDGKSHTGSNRDSKLFGNECVTQTPTLFAYQTRQMKKPFPYKADSETERIARIMQGSVNYWRKGDEHALTSDDDSVDSFDSDDDEDCYF